MIAKHTRSGARLRRAGIAVAFAVLLPASQSRAQYTTTTHATCVGGAIGCTQMDFFIEFLGLSSGLTLDAFTLALNTPGYLFASPGTTEAEDALGFNFYDPLVLNAGQSLFGAFALGAYVDPAITSILRIRAEMLEFPPTIADASEMAFVYDVSAGGSSVASGEFIPTTATPEPASLVLLATGLAGLGVIRRRRAKSSSLLTA